MSLGACLLRDGCPVRRIPPTRQVASASKAMRPARSPTSAESTQGRSRSRRRVGPGRRARDHERVLSRTEQGLPEYKRVAMRRLTAQGGEEEKARPRHLARGLQLHDLLCKEARRLRALKLVARKLRARKLKAKSAATPPAVRKARKLRLAAHCPKPTSRLGEAEQAMGILLRARTGDLLAADAAAPCGHIRQHDDGCAVPASKVPRHECKTSAPSVCRSPPGLDHPHPRVPGTREPDQQAWRHLHGGPRLGVQDARDAHQDLVGEQRLPSPFSGALAE